MDATFFYLDQMHKRLTALRELRYRNKRFIHQFAQEVGENKCVNPQPPTYAGNNTIDLGDFWSGRDAYLWLHHEMEIPQAWKDETVVGVFDFGITGIGNNSSFESMLYLDGKEFQGVDTNHQEVFFPLELAGSKAMLDFRLWSGLEGGGKPQTQYHQLKTAFIACLDEATDDLYYFGMNLLESIQVMDEQDPMRYQLQNILVETMKYVDYTNPESESFYESIRRADDYLNQQLSQWEGKQDIDITCVGHTHIDVAWLWRLKHTREKASRSFSTVLRLMERFDEYYFLQTQAQLYDYIKEDFPEIYEAIKRRVAEGKWEPSGSMWVEADCNLTSGESIVRQILYGKKFFKKEFNYENTFLWLPDVFGYSWALPQILKKSGIDTFITTKISWNEVNRMPNDTFTWRGIDGSEVLTHFVTTPDVDSTTKFYTYNGNIKPQIVKGIWNNYRNKDVNQSLLLSYGYGDGGGGVNRDMLENRRRIDKIPSMPRTTTGKVTDYLKTLHSTLNDTKNLGYLPVWDSELYLEFHRGTYTSQAYNKYMNRKMELAYRDAEILSVMEWVEKETSSVYPTTTLEEGWKIILRNQFHDIIPGSSIHEVYEDSREEYTKAASLVEGILREKEGNNQEGVVMNSASWKRSEVIRCNGKEGYALIDSKTHETFPMQDIEGDAYYYVEDMEPVELRKVSFVKEENTELAGQVQSGYKIDDVPFTVGERCLETPYSKIEWNEQGQLIKVYDKTIGANILSGAGNEWQIFEDKPREYDAWELEATIDDKKEIIDDFVGSEVIACGPLLVKIRFRWLYNKTTITQDLIAYHHTERIDFETSVDWQERDKVIKVAFPVDVRGVNARYDIQYGSVERPTHRSTSWDAAKFEVVGHQWANLEEKGLGVALMNNCKYGYDIKDNVMRLTVLKSATFPDPTADQGMQSFTYSLYAHKEAWNESRLVEEAWSLNAPLRVVADRGFDHQEKPFFDIDVDGVMLDAMKKTEDGDKIVLRFHEYHGGKTKMHLRFNRPIKGWYPCNLMEEGEGDLREVPVIEVTFRPFEIKTFIVEL